MNSRRFVFFSPAPLFRLTLAPAVCLMLGGCVRLNPPQEAAPLPPQPEVVAPVADPNAFAWESHVLEAVGISPATKSSGSIPQRAMAAKLSAKKAAILNLRQQIEQLPINEEATVGAAMDTVISVRKGIDQAVQRVEIIGEQSREDGTYEVRVRTPLAPIAEVLRQNYITPNDPLPEPPATGDSRLGPLT